MRGDGGIGYRVGLQARKMWVQVPLAPPDRELCLGVAEPELVDGAGCEPVYSEFESHRSPLSTVEWRDVRVGLSRSAKPMRKQGGFDSHSRLQVYGDCSSVVERGPVKPCLARVRYPSVTPFI